PPQAAGGPLRKSCRRVHRYTSSGGGRFRQPRPAGFVLMSCTDELPLTLFDRRAWRLHRDRAARQGCVEFLHAEIADRLVDRFGSIEQQVRRGLGLGAHPRALSRTLRRPPGIERGGARDPSTGLLGGVTRKPG